MSDRCCVAHPPFSEMDFLFLQFSKNWLPLPSQREESWRSFPPRDQDAPQEALKARQCIAWLSGLGIAFLAGIMHVLGKKYSFYFFNTKVFIFSPTFFPVFFLFTWSLLAQVM